MARTRLELVEAVREACGFMDWLAVTTEIDEYEGGAPTDVQETMAGLMARLRAQLGIFPPQEAASPTTLLDLRTRMMRLLGYGVQAENPPPGQAEELDATLNEAQQMIHRRLELGLETAAPAFMVGDAATTTIDPELVITVAMTISARHKNKPDAPEWKERSERMLADYGQRNPPNIEQRLRLALVSAQRTLARRYQVTQDASVTLDPFYEDDDEPTFDPQAIFLLALSDMKGALGQPDAKVVREDWMQYLADLERRLPANAISTITRYVREANTTLFSRYQSLRQPKSYVIELVDGQSAYPLEDLDIERISEIGIERAGVWYSLRDSSGLGARYSYPNDTGWPSRYYFEGGTLNVWPTPGPETQSLVLRSRDVMQPFSDDGDFPSVDDQAVFLHATAAAKGYFRQPDAQLYLRDLDAYIRERVAASHGTKRYNADRRSLFCDATSPSPYPVPAEPYP